MARTIIESKSKTAIIGFDEPFCVIGERINPTGRKKLALELEAGNFTTVESDALAQVEAGANILDINAGVVYNSNPNPNETEPPLMVDLINLVQNLTDIPLCIDSSVPAALEAGLEAAEGRPLLNSVTGEEDRLEFVLPLVKKYNVPVVAISNDDTGISEDPDVRFTVAKKIVERAADFNIPAQDIVAMGAGMTSAIMNPVALPVSTKKIEEKKEEVQKAGIILPADLDQETFVKIFGLGSTKSRAGKEMEAIRAANLLTDNDPHGSSWIQFNKPSSSGSQVSGRGGRRGGRRRTT